MVMISTLDAEQNRAMKSLKDALMDMEASGFGSDGIRSVLEKTFPGICHEMAGYTSDTNWRRDTDPFFRATPAGQIRAAELEMEGRIDEAKMHVSLDSLFKFNPDGEGNFIARPPKEQNIYEARKWILESFEQIAGNVDVPTGLPHRVGRVLELLRDYMSERESTEDARRLWRQIKRQM